MKIAVVGAGISGLSAAWLLAKKHEVALFEKNAHVGGHSDTADVSMSGADRLAELSGARTIPVDTGFIVYNPPSYPNLVALFDHLGVPSAETEMSFAVSLGSGRYEYSGNGLSGLFAQRRNVFNAAHWGMARDILRFFRDVAAIDPTHLDPDISIGAWLEANGYRGYIVERHIVPMGAAIWSTPAGEMLGFPMAAFARFFANHGLLIADVNKRPPWRTVRGGSRVYVQSMLADYAGRFEVNCGVKSISREASGVRLFFADGASQHFDQCVIATHADEALGLLADADEAERGLLGAFGYSRNAAVLHSDVRLMPKRKRAWASWNYTGDGRADVVSVTYWMNRLQPLETAQDLFVTLNPWRAIAKERIIKSMTYKHPIFDVRAMTAQNDLWSLQGRRRTWFAGSYFGYGFHEDGLQSGLAVAEDLGGVGRPWAVEDARSRILSRGAQGRGVDQVAAA